MEIIVVAYRPEWVEAFKAEAAHIRRILGDNLLQIFHIGSTSVPGLQAKPIIDIMPVVRSLARVDTSTAAFEGIGYEVMGEFGMPGRRYMRKGGDKRSHQIHTFQYDNVADIMRHLVFRDYLRSRPDICSAYGKLKSGLAKRFPSDIGAYCDGKDDFVKRVEREALQWHWENVE